MSEEKKKGTFVGPGGFRYETVAPPKNFKDVFRFIKEVCAGFFSRLFYIFSLVWKTGPWILILLFSMSVLTGVLPIIGSLLSKEILNELQNVVMNVDAVKVPESEFLKSPVVFLLVFFFIYRILTRLVAKLEISVNRIAGELVVRRVKIDIMQKAKEIDLGAYDLPDFYEKLENANREAGIRPVSILSSVFAVISTVISLASYVVVLSAALPLATVAMFIIAIPAAIVNFVYRRKNFAYMRRRSKERRQMTYYSEIMVNKDLVKEIRMFDLGDTFIEKFCKVFDNYFRGLRRLIISENLWTMAVVVLSSIVNCFFYVVIAYSVFEGKYMIGDYSLYTGALVSISGYVSTLIGTSASIYEGTLFIDNLMTFMKAEPTIKPVETPAALSRGGHTVEFQNVSFSYPGTDIKVLDNINLKFEPGETVVLVGLNGAGKTTLIKLLTRLYDPTEGRILLDGTDLRDYDPKELYKIFGIIFQDFGKYACTVSENIQFGEIHAEHDGEKVKEAAIAANADDYIIRLPNGYETPLMRFFEQNGLELSVGQWQKLAIARAFYSDSDILILDEPTAALDAIAEQEIYNQFDTLRHDKTTVFVSHRLSSATVASKIVVLEYGKVVEEGTHHELMEQKGRYYELFSTQAKRYIEEEIE